MQDLQGKVEIKKNNTSIECINRVEKQSDFCHLLEIFNLAMMEHGY